MDIARYESISTKKGQNFDERIIANYKPTPTDLDYERGYIERYFIQKANDKESRISEVDIYGFKKFSTNPFYTNIKIDWKIKGTDEEIKKANSKSIQLSYEKMPKLAIFLPNLIQFKKKIDLELL